MKRREFIFGLLNSLLFMGCGTKAVSLSNAADPGISYPDARFLVISDPHFYDTVLGSSGSAFQAYLDRDRKLLVKSGEILETAVKQMAAETADFVLVAGDLTKDGEQICHQGAAKRLRPLLDSGKKVIVVPGNHDISNPESVRYEGSSDAPEPSVGPAAFKQIYHDFGYSDAIAMDDDSLSYVTEPVEGLWILALDSNKYRKNRPGHHAMVGGEFTKETLAWITARLKEAQNREKAVIAVLHHGIMEHYPANEKFYDEYMVDDYEAVAALLAAHGVRLAFTGHFHAQDITYKDVELDNGQTHRIFDVETGSLVTAPCPFRKVTISDNQARISSRFITAIPSMGEDFKDYAADYVFNGTKKLANAKLTKFKVSKDEQDKINGQISKAYTTHLKGDEVKPEKAVDNTGFGTWLKFIAWYQNDLLEGWYTDLAPADNELEIDLLTGRTG